MDLGNLKRICENCSTAWMATPSGNAGQTGFIHHLIILLVFTIAVALSCTVGGIVYHLAGWIGVSTYHSAWPEQHMKHHIPTMKIEWHWYSCRLGCAVATNQQISPLVWAPTYYRNSIQLLAVATATTHSLLRVAWKSDEVLVKDFFFFFLLSALSRAVGNPSWRSSSHGKMVTW